MRLNTNHAATLAVALGIGAAIAAAAPAAWADDTQTGSGRTQSAQPAAATVKQNRPAAATAAAGASTSLKVSRSGQGPVRLRRGSTAAAELSGITYADGNSYYAVGDNGATSIWQVNASVNSRQGRITSAKVSGGISAPAMGRDSEGVTLTPERTGVWVSDEVASTITKFNLATGLMTGSVAVPAIYRPANVQGNFGLESLAYGAGKLWTGNEEALRTDGPLSTTTAGSWVRIQRFGGTDFTPEVQYAYRTDPIARMSPLTDAERSGLVDLVALPDGEVLSLERELGGFLPRFRSRIYLLDFSGATDVSDVASLNGGGFTPVAKTLLWQGFFQFANFEGVTLGPQLSNGSQSMVLVSDDGSGQLGQRQTLLSLKLKGLV